MIKVVCGTITGVVSLINIVTMLYALMHSNSLQDGNPPTLGSAIKNLGLFSKSPGDFRIEAMDF